MEFLESSEYQYRTRHLRHQNTYRIDSLNTSCKPLVFTQTTLHPIIQLLGDNLYTHILSFWRQNHPSANE